MKRIVIEGQTPLKGKICIGGAKNSAVALLPASLLADGICTISNVPNISDRDALFDIIELLNGQITHNNDSITIDATNIKNVIIPQELSVKLRASYYFMGVLLARFHHVEIFFPGGCKIGARPIDLHLMAFEKMGAIIKRDGDKYTIDAEDLHGANIYLDFPSVGATVNILLAATLANGVTVIENAAREPEIITLSTIPKLSAKPIPKLSKLTPNAKINTPQKEIFIFSLSSFL